MEHIVDTLFPQHEITEYAENIMDEEIPMFSTEEVRQTLESLQNKKAPGPDGIPAEVLTIVGDKDLELLLNMYNGCLKTGCFHKV